MASPAAASALVTGLPENASLGDVEGLVRPKCSGRIVAIGMQSQGVALVEFSLLADAESCYGEHQVRGHAVRISRDGEPAPPPPSGGRTRGSRAVAHAEPVAVVASPAPPAAPAPAPAPKKPPTPKKLPTPVLPPSASQAPPAPAQVVVPVPAPAAPAAVAPPAPAEPPIPAASPPPASEASASSLASSQTTVEVALPAPAPAPAPAAAPKKAAPKPKPAAVEEPSVGVQVVECLPAEEGAPTGPASKKQRSETKKEKERRLNRVGLSYRCGRCGQPKKGHVCLPEGAAATSGESPEGGSAGGSKDAAAKGSTPPSGGPGWDLDSDSIFKDIKSVLQTPAGAAAPAGSANGNGAPAEKPSGSKRSRSKKTPPPLPADLAAACPPPQPSTEKTALLEELDIAMQRPPSLITPEDGERGAGGPISGAPLSMMSASDMFSPGQLMTHLLGTPTPAITPGLSPGTLNELGNMLQSPAAALASARKAQADAAAYEAEANGDKA